MVEVETPESVATAAPLTPINQIAPVTLRELTVRFGEVRAVNHLTLEISPGSVYALLGRNGAGKSSLIHALLGLRRPDEGSARLFGRDSWRHRAELVAAVGVVPEEPEAPPDRTPRALGIFSSRVYPTWDAKGFEAQLNRHGVPLDRAFAKLSRGQKTLVALSLALASHPRLLVLDDPTLGLDPVARRSVLDELVDELAGRSTTILLATHDLDGVERLADRVGFLSQGRLLVDEPLDALKARHRLLTLPAETSIDLSPWRPVRERLTGWGRETVLGALDGADLPPALAAFGSRLEPMSLEAIFRAHLGEIERSVA